MFKKVYVFAWFLLIGSTLTSILSGAFDVLAFIAVSVGVAGLVYAFGLWAVLRNAPATE